MHRSALLLLVPVLLSCRSPEGLSTQQQPDSSREPASVAGPARDSDPVVQAKADLSRRLGVPASELVVRRQEEVVWPNGGLGCPHHEQEYDPAPVPGYRIVLVHSGLEHHFHGAAGEPPFRCEFLD